MFLIVVVFILGACIGSFLNVVMFRTHAGETIGHGRSKCRSCEAPVDARDLVPVLSFFLLRGRCRHCQSSISWQYPAVEMTTGFLFVLFYLLVVTREGDHLGLLSMTLYILRDWIFAAYLIIIFVYDLRHMLIIDRFTVPAMILAIVLNLWLGLVPAWSVFLGGLVLAGFFWIQFAVSKGAWVGGGDIRMGALMGFMLGLQNGLVALFLAYVLGAIIGVAMMVKGYATRKTPIPFGSFLALATLLTLFIGEPLLGWYLNLFL